MKNNETEITTEHLEGDDWLDSEFEGENIRDGLNDIIYLMALQKIGDDYTHDDALDNLVDMEQETLAGVWLEVQDVDPDWYEIRDPLHYKEIKKWFKGWAMRIAKARLVRMMNRMKKKTDEASE